uniref:PTC1m n=1 Tax=Volvox carteri f. nagariensis TaxID=3068 RepID=D9CJ49_VOLCA|nr:PTC1m [Volvox carteri f. nagariensis]
MKFTHQLKFNSVPEWREHYIQYAHLKKYIYALAKKEANLQFGGQVADDELHTPLVPENVRSGQGISEEGFQRELDSQLAAIVTFFALKEAELLAKVSELELDVQSLEKIPNRQEASSLLRLSNGGVAMASNPTNRLGTEVVGIAPTVILPSPSTLDLARMVHTCPTEDHRKVRVLFWENPPRHVFSNLHARRVKLQGRFQDLYIGLHDLREYLHINKEGFRKIIKKHDKLTRSVDLRARWWPNVEVHLAPDAKQQELDRAIAALTDHYAVLYMGSCATCGCRKGGWKAPVAKVECFLLNLPTFARLTLVLIIWRGDTGKADEQLSRGLREHITVERNTVWRDMAAMERKYAAVSVKQAAAPGSLSTSGNWLRLRWAKLAACCAVFIVLLNIEIWPDSENGPKNKCLALLIFASMMWSLEAVPLFVTSMALPLLVVMTGVLVDRRDGSPPRRLTPQQAAPAIFHAMFSQTIMLLLGGFSIAAALSKHAIAKQVAVAILSRVGRKPRNVLLAAMLTATFASMWISNVAAPVLCFGLIQPILRTLDPGHPFAKSLVMGIALASNVGGMTSPISSPQNIFAMERMSLDGRPPSWLSWFAVTLPVSAACNIVCWGLLLVAYQPGRTIAEVRPIKPNTDPVNGTQVYIVIVSLLTVAAWCANTYLQRYIGEMGVIAIVPLVAFFGFDVLSKDDFNSFLWNVVMLAMGGLSLGIMGKALASQGAKFRAFFHCAHFAGEAVKSSGLLEALAMGISEMITNLTLFQVAAVFCGMVLVATTFISHTVGAMIILPIVQSVGEKMSGSTHPKLLVMAAALMCSGAMGLPVSGFPNMNAVSLEDSTGNPIVSMRDFLCVGVPSSLLAYFIIVTIGYCLMLLTGF